MKNPFSSPCKALFICQNAIEWRRRSYYVNTFTAFELRPWKLVIFTRRVPGEFTIWVILSWYLYDTLVTPRWYSDGYFVQVNLSGLGVNLYTHLILYSIQNCLGMILSFCKLSVWNLSFWISSKGSRFVEQVGIDWELMSARRGCQISVNFVTWMTLFRTLDLTGVKEKGPLIAYTHSHKNSHPLPVLTLSTRTWDHSACRLPSLSNLLRNPQIHLATPLWAPC